MGILPEWKISFSGYDSTVRMLFRNRNLQPESSDPAFYSTTTMSWCRMVLCRKCRSLHKKLFLLWWYVALRWWHIVKVVSGVSWLWILEDGRRWKGVWGGGCMKDGEWCLVLLSIDWHVSSLLMVQYTVRYYSQPRVDRCISTNLVCWRLWSFCTLEIGRLVGGFGRAEKWNLLNVVILQLM